MLGVHLSLEQNPSDTVRAARQHGMTTFQMFIRNNRNGRRRYWSQDNIDAFNLELIKAGIEKWVAHAPYIWNPGNPLRIDDIIAQVIDDAQLLEKFQGTKYICLHPGSANYVNWRDAIDSNIVLLKAFEAEKFNSVVLTLENMAGAGSQLLSTCEQLDYLMERYPAARLTWDTCHAFGAGINSVYGLIRYNENIDVLHVNDSIGLYGSNVDRHANLKTGAIPFDLLLWCCYQKVDAPCILETPGDGLIKDYEMLQSMLK